MQRATTTSVLFLLLFIIYNVGQAQIPTYIPTSGLVAYYGFDGNANDLSGRSNHGTLQCDPGASNPTLTTDRFGAANKAYLFGGMDNRNWIKINNSSSLSFTNSLTISFWMKQSSARGMSIDNNGNSQAVNADAHFTVIAKGGVNQPGEQTNPVSAGFRIESSYLSSNAQKFSFHNTSTDVLHYDVQVVSSYNCYSANQWLHVVYTIEPNKACLYIDGVLRNEIVGQTPNFSVANTKPLYIGRLDGGDETYFPFSGVIDDIAIYNRALNNNEVRQIFNNFQDPLSAQNRIVVNSVNVTNPCGSNSGTITINAQPRSGVTYQYALGNQSSTQNSNVLTAGPGTHRCFVVSPCAVWDTTITLQCNCTDDPTLVKYDSICPGEQGIRGSIDVVADYTFNNNAQGWTGSGSHIILAANEDNYSYFQYGNDCDDWYYIYIYPGTGECRPLFLTTPQRHAHTGKAWFFGTYYGDIRNWTASVTSPAVNVPCDPSRASITFWYFAESVFDDWGREGHNTITLNVSSSSSSGYRQLWTTGGVEADSWRQATVSLSSLPSSGNYYFRFTNNGAGYVSMIDDVQLKCDNRRSIPVEVTSAPAGTTVTIDNEISAGDANSCPITETTFWYIKPTSEHHEEITVPPPSYTWHGSTYSANGTYPWNNGGRLKNRLGCDSTDYLHLTLDINNRYNDNQMVCDSLTWNGRHYTSSAEDSVKCYACNQWGGDSTTYLHLTISYTSVRDSVVVSCFPFVWIDTIFEESVTTMAHLQTIANCDSLVTLHFTRHHADTTYLHDTLCGGHTYTFAGQNYTIGGDYSAFLYNRFHCDSTVYLTLDYFPSYEFRITDSIEQDDLPYISPINGVSYNYELRNELIHYVAAGLCDSNYLLTLRVHYNLYDCDDFLQFPNVITPNGDGQNDRFYIRGLENGCYPLNELRIYNRWGALVFIQKNISSGLDTWEPTHLPAGTYFYRFHARNTLKSLERFGTVEVIKE